MMPIHVDHPSPVPIAITAGACGLVATRHRIENFGAIEIYSDFGVARVPGHSPLAHDLVTVTLRIVTIQIVHFSVAIVTHSSVGISF